MFSKLLRDLASIVEVTVKRPPTVIVRIGTFVSHHVLNDERGAPVDFNIGKIQRRFIELTGKDGDDAPEAFPAPPTWAVSDQSILRIFPSEDGTRCEVRATRPPVLGTAIVTATDTPDPDVPPLTFNVTVVGGRITHLDATVSPPTDISPDELAIPDPPVSGPSPGGTPTPAPPSPPIQPVPGEQITGVGPTI